MKGRRTAVGLALIAAFVAGCGTETLNTENGQRQIERAVAKATGRHVKATCPQDVPIRKGLVTLCTLTAPDGTRATVRVVQTDTEGDVHFTSPLVHTASVEQNIASSASRKLGFAVKVTCPDLVEATTGTKFRCRATDAHGRSAPVTVTTLGPQAFHYDIGSAGSNA